MTLRGNRYGPVAVGVETAMSGTTSERHELVVRYGSAHRTVLDTFDDLAVAARASLEVEDALGQSFGTGAEHDMEYR